MATVDRRWLLEQIMGTAELLDTTIAPHAAALLADDLMGYPQDVIAKALARVRGEHRGRLTLKAIVDRIDQVAGRPSASEAWAMAVNALDERKTVVWTVEMVDAWGVVSDLAQRGDLIGARMGFIQAYDRLVAISRDERQLPQVMVSEGWDLQLRSVAIDKAIQLGYMDPKRDSAELARVGYDPGAADGDKSVMLEYRDGKPQRMREVPKGFHPDIAARLVAAKADLVSKPERARTAKELKWQQEDEELRRRKEETQRRVDERLRKDGAQ